ncbi:MAG: UbiA family prenyltransferase [Coriobacteriia bacterium]|nr:UbiA family prenyltransferase [Coriobacteriia bacterium]MBN2821880.1 UbiA family prenyltransferase [Coriobacteriia bacterium]
MSKIAEKTRVLLELVKFEHSIFALPYAYIGALYAAAPGWPTLSEFVWVTVAMVGARSFAFVVNRAADKEIDARNPRTAGRAIPAGLIKAWELWLFSAVVLGTFLFAVWQLEPITRWLWPIVLGVFVIYPYTKRFTPLCHYWLGLCLGLAPVGAWVAVSGSLADPAPWVLGAAVALWTAGFDIIYATQDVECDVRDGVHSMPADLGVRSALVQTRIAHLLTVALLVTGGLLAGAGWPWYAGVGVAAALMWYENGIVKADDLTRVNAAFFTVNGVIAVVVGAGAVIDRLIG